ncbi:unnamed protein product [Sphenostylis stenocarpa]|uniref:Uncharacterized protein n=1 Tax=Sphenostylis stenocarpa TaxID=92480 RepID=A0AA86SV06_9FABA|nr:unnamed protein product [Sphenostylis stenocarpa]
MLYAYTVVRIYSKREIYAAFLLVKINRKKGQNEEKPLFSNPEAVGLIKVQTLMNNDECAWTKTCGTFHGFLSFDILLSPQDPLGTCSPITPQFRNEIEHIPIRDAPLLGKLKPND